MYWNTIAVPNHPICDLNSWTHSQCCIQSKSNVFAQAIYGQFLPANVILNPLTKSTCFDTSYTRKVIPRKRNLNHVYKARLIVVQWELFVATLPSILICLICHIWHFLDCFVSYTIWGSGQFYMFIKFWGSCVNIFHIINYVDEEVRGPLESIIKVDTLNLSGIRRCFCITISNYLCKVSHLH